LYKRTLLEEAFVARMKPTANVSQDKKTSNVVCNHFARHGTCKFGAGCRFKHDAQVPQSARRVCEFFMRHGRCDYGTQCRFKHDIGAPSAPLAKASDAVNIRPLVAIVKGAGSSFGGNVRKMRGFVVALLKEEAEFALILLTQEGSGLSLVGEIARAHDDFGLDCGEMKLQISFQRIVVGMLHFLVKVEHTTNALSFNKFVAALMAPPAFFPRVFELTGRLLERGSFADLSAQEEDWRYGEYAWEPLCWGDLLEPVVALGIVVLSKSRDVLADVIILRQLRDVTRLALQRVDLPPKCAAQTNALHRLALRGLGEEEAHTVFMARRQREQAVVVMQNYDVLQQRPAGGRHDNDFADFRRTLILPTAQELLCSEAPFVPQNIPFYTETVELYLDMQFRLLREDFVRPVQVGLSQFHKAGGLGALQRHVFVPKSNTSVDGAGKVFVYRRVEFEGLSAVTKGTQPLQFSICFQHADRTKGMSSRERERFWESSQRLKFGSLVVLWEDGPTICVFKVANRDSKMLGKDKPLISLACESEMVPLALQLFKSRTEVALLEFSSGYLEAYRPTLSALQRLNPVSLPFARYLTGSGDVAMRVPAYVAGAYRVDLGLLSKSGAALHADLSLPDSFPLTELVEHSTLDPSQAEALKAMLCQEISLIQGPPGCGKTFIGIQFVKLLIGNNVARSGPILCVCYTNHALDQFLEGILDEGVTSIARVGSRVQCERLKAFQLRELEYKEKRGRPARGLWEEFEEMGERIGGFQRMLFEKDKLRLADVIGILQYECPDLLDGFLVRAPKDGFRLAGDGDVFSLWLAGKDLGRVVKKKEEKLEKAGAASRGNEFLLLEKKKRSKKIEEPRVDEETESDEGAATVERPLRELKDCSDPYSFTLRERYALAAYLQEELRQQKLDEVATVCRRYEELRLRIQAAHDQRKVEVLRRVRVIGATTTGAASLVEVLQAVKPSVLICEEAAEILEAHVLSALSSSVQQLVMIGDHMQLRPKVELYEFSAERDNVRGARYDLDLSLFERLLLRRKSVPVVRLTIQHRMRPEIADLIRPQVYETLLDHAKVSLYPPVLGASTNLFFWNCADTKESKDAGLNSYVNTDEAERVVALVRFLCLQSYSKNAITVLSPYVGQLLLLRRMLAKEHSVAVAERDEEAIQGLDLSDSEDDGETGPRYVPLKALSSHVRIATIDNFQGEESDVVVISLVRSNPEGKIGFLKSQNRINVMLSRAKHGMFVVGNADMLERSRNPFWCSVVQKFRSRNALSNVVPLCCQKHPDHRLQLRTAEDFLSKSPDGGCLLPCHIGLSCGHVCRRFCHSDDPTHRCYKCTEPCRRVPDCGHPCRLLCYEDCGLCPVRVPITFERCGHDGIVRCSAAKTAKCETLLQERFLCGHVCSAPCWKIGAGLALCTAKCGASLGSCSHSCAGNCVDCATKPHPKCQASCPRVQVCGHVCGAVCHGEAPCNPCNKKCASQCAHRFV
jgi:hypothetical protein